MRQYQQEVAYIVQLNLRTVSHLGMSYLDRELMRWRSWLRHCAKSQKVAGSIPDVVIGIFH